MFTGLALGIKGKMIGYPYFKYKALAFVTNGEISGLLSLGVRIIPRQLAIARVI